MHWKVRNVPLFKTETQRGVWLEHHCKRCWREADCAILKRALRTDRKPVEWERKSRPRTMSETYKCSEFGAQPPRITKGERQFDDVPMFDMEEHDVHLVPVDGWPDQPKKDKTGDHA